MTNKFMRFLELCLISLFSIWATKANEINDTKHTVLYVFAAVLVIIWIVIDTNND